MSEGVAERIERVKEAFDADQRRLDVGDDADSCQLCKVVTADRYEEVQHEETGMLMTVALCDDCWQKTLDYDAGEDVDFSSELRLNDRYTGTDTDAEQSG